MAQFPFSYNNIQGVYEYTPFGKETLTVNDQLIAKTGKDWVLADGTNVKRSFENFLIPKLLINDTEIKLVTLKKWEWVLVLLPALFFALGGISPAIAAFIGVYINLSIVMAPQRSSTQKILLSLGVVLGTFMVLVVVSTILYGILGGYE
jgi:hypothetical protein